MILKVTDSTGLQHTSSVFILPDKVNVSFDTVPSGLNVQLDGISRQTPFISDSLKGFRHTISAPTQSSGGTSYTFGSWSDGGTQTHGIVVPTTNQSYVATFQASTGPPGLAAAYAFDEGVGTSVTDASGSGNTGAIGTATWSTAGRFGSALSFNGSGARVTVPDSASLDLTTGMTLEAWVFPTAGGSAWRDVIYKGQDDIYYLMSSSDADRPAAGGTFSGWLYGTSAVPLNVWSHLAATFDGSTLRLLVNGVQVASRPVLVPIGTSSGALTIGGDALYGQHFAGRIDEVRIYNTALSATQIQADMATAVGNPGQDTQPPTAPTGLSATVVSASQINLAWTASTDNVGVTGYRVERCLGGGCSNFVQVSTPPSTSFNDTGLAASTSYSYRVRAADAAGNLSGYSSIQNATTQAGPDTQPPTVPSGLSASAVSASQVNLSWTASTDNVAVTGYRVERCLGAACSNFVQVATPPGASFNDTGLAPATTYRYRVRAADAAANLSGYSSIQNATTQAPDTQPPTAPSGLLATGFSLSQINLSWTASTDNVGVTGYRVERCQGAGCSNFVQVATPLGASFNDTGLAASTSYRYRVRATDAAGNLGPYSAVQIGTTFQESTVFTGLTNPSAIEFAGDGRVFVAEKGGSIKVFDSLTDAPPTVFADLSDQRAQLLGSRAARALRSTRTSRPAAPTCTSSTRMTHRSAESPPTLGGPACPTPPGATGDGCVVSARLSRLTGRRERHDRLRASPDQRLVPAVPEPLDRFDSRSERTARSTSRAATARASTSPTGARTATR